MRSRKTFTLIIKRRANADVWHYRAYDAEGRRRTFSLGIEAKGEASETLAYEKALALFKADALIPEDRELKKARGATLGVYARGFFDDSSPYARRGGRRGGYSANFLATHRAGLKFILARLGHSKVKSVTAAAVEKMLAAAREERKPDGSRRYSEKTLLNYLTTLKIVLDEARRAGIIERSPFDDPEAIRRPAKKAARPREALSAEEARALLAPGVIKSEIVRDALIVLLGTGLRVGELRALRGDAVDLERLILTVRLSYSRLEGPKSPKSGESRLVPLPASVAAVLKKYRGYRGDGPLFTISGKAPISERYIRGQLEAGLERIGLPIAEQRRRRLSVHSLRATYNSLHVIAGSNAELLRAAVGHTSEEMTRRYLSLRAEDLAPLAAVAERVLAPSTPTQAAPPALTGNPQAPASANLDEIARQLAAALEVIKNMKP